MGCAVHSSNRVLLFVVFWTLLLGVWGTDTYRCLDYWRPIGRVLHEISSPGQQLTVGKLARECNAHCSADPDCTAAWTVGAVATAGPICRLLSHTAADVTAALQPVPGQSYPQVVPDFTARNGSQEKSLSWLCLKHERDWDELGAITHRLVRRGAQEPAWCAYATDAAGNNLDNWQGVHSPSSCGDSCAASSQCSFWVFRLGYCWLKSSSLFGPDGWTAAYRPAWLDQAVQPNAAMVCFKRVQDWRELGQQLGPTVESTQYEGLHYTLFPERVNYTEAAAACSYLPDGRLAQLDTQAALTVVSKALLPTLPMQYTLQAAWVGAMGVLDNATNDFFQRQHIAFLPSGAQSSPDTSTVGGTALAGGSVPTWQGTHQAVNSSLWTHPSEHYLQWRGSDPSFSKIMPQAGKPVCVAAVGVPSSPAATSAGPRQEGVQSVPGLYLFTCRRPTAYICQSTSLPTSLTRQMGRIVPQATLLAQAGPGRSLERPSKQQLALAIILPVLGVLVLVLVLSCVCLRQFRWFLRSLSTQRKRAMGLPSKGSLTVAVTDIQAYTKLSEAHPQAMGQALLAHNQVIREAAYSNAGHVLAQEGDSFIVGFSEPLDAAVFALQVQHRLLQLEVSPVIKYDGDDADVSTEAPNGLHLGRMPSRATSPFSVSLLPHSLTNPTDVETGATAGRCPSNAHSGLPVLQHTTGSTGIKIPAGRHASTSGSTSPSGPLQTIRDCNLDPASFSQSESGKLQRPRTPSTHLMALLCPWGRVNSASSGSGSSQGAVLSQTFPAGQHACRAAGLHSMNGTAAVQQPPAGIRRPSSLSRWLSSSAGHWVRTVLTHNSHAGQPALFKGLRVRVGLATGPITKGQPVDATAAYSMARVISECAAGGQVLLDAATFQTVRPQLHLLGAVTAAGLDYRSLDAAPQDALRADCWQACRSSRQGTGRGRPAAREAIVLDMGLYETALRMLPLAAVEHYAASRPASCTSSLQHSHSSTYGASRTASQSALAALRAISYGVFQELQVQPARSDAAVGGCACVQLYQLLAPGLARRAVVFGNQLALCDSWRCLDPPFFAAPGLQDAAQQPSVTLNTADTAAALATEAQLLTGSVHNGFPQQPMQASCSDPVLSTRGCSTTPGASILGHAMSGQQPGSMPSDVNALRTLSISSGVAADVLRHGGYGQVCFPPVAVVFVAVEGSEGRQQARDPCIEHIHVLLHRLMLEACVLMQGYLVKTQESELKAMAVFSTPAAAVEWCMLVQSAALHLPYPADVLQQQRFRSVCDAAGNLVFRGPRMKMGVAEGSPTCIIPDHMGRADYLGPAVNQAARVCDAAAHGGQVAMEQGLARRVLQHWSNSSRQQQQQHTAPCDAAVAAPSDAPAREHCSAAPGTLLVNGTAAAHAVKMQGTHSASCDAAAVSDVHAVAAEVAHSTGDFVAVTVAQPTSPTKQRDAVSGVMPGVTHPAGLSHQHVVHVPVQVVVQQLGSFLLKGCAKSLHIVNFTPQSLAGRQYPDGPPKGKGVRLAHTHGVMGVATVLLPSKAADVRAFV